MFQTSVRLDRVDRVDGSTVSGPPVRNFQFFLLQKYLEGDMRTNASISWSLGVAAALVVTTVPLQAQRELFRWSGRVDQEVQLVVSGQTVTTSRLGPSERGENRLNVMA